MASLTPQGPRGVRRGVSGPPGGPRSGAHRAVAAGQECPGHLSKRLAAHTWCRWCPLHTTALKPSWLWPFKAHKEVRGWVLDPGPPAPILNAVAGRDQKDTFFKTNSSKQFWFWILTSGDTYAKCVLSLTRETLSCQALQNYWAARRNWHRNGRWEGGKERKDKHHKAELGGCLATLVWALLKRWAQRQRPGFCLHNQGTVPTWGLWSTALPTPQHPLFQVNCPEVLN